MNLQSIIKRYNADNRYTKLFQHLKLGASTKVHLKGLVGSQRSFLITALNQLENRPHILIANDKESAAYWQNDIDTLMDKKRKSLFFPDSFRRPTGFDKLNRTNVFATYRNH